MSEAEEKKEKRLPNEIEDRMLELLERAESKRKAKVSDEG